MFTRKDVSAQLNEAARLLEVLGEDPFRVRSFQSAARAFESYQGDVGALYRESGFRSIRGVGAGTDAELRAMFEVGVLPTLADLREKVPDEVKAMFAVSGLGAKRIGLLWRNDIEGIEGIITAAEDGRLASLPGLGAKSALKLLEGARFAATARARMRLDEAHRLSEAIVSALHGEIAEVRAQVAGEYRRGFETIAEIDVVVAGLERATLVDVAARLLDERDKGDAEGLSGSLMGRRVRFTPTTVNAFGATLALRTGNHEFVDTLLERAERMGVDLQDPVARDGLDAPDEETFLAWLGLPGIAPELRESAAPISVTGLLELSDVRGLVHNHSTWSDGALSIREMVSVAKGLGYRYLAMADHSGSSVVANGLTPERVEAQAEEIRAIRRELADQGNDFDLLHGIEVDILPDGTLDLPDELLAQLDYTVVSVHQNFGLSREAQTERVVRAVQNPNVYILGHATGRLLLRRPGYDVDLQAVIEACARTGTIIEINANPRRLDLDWRWVIRAKALGCLFSINPDAHSGDGFDDLRYGVTVARKAGLTPAEVVNTAWNGSGFLDRLRRLLP
ncbi:MAG: PHP domain-containing protein [Trueperaceae bacterium]